VQPVPSQAVPPQISRKAKVLVTGGAGYIGSHTALALKNAGYDVVILDNLVYGHADIVKDVLKLELVVGDTNDRAFLDQLFQVHKFDAVMHFAAYAYVGESVTQPDKYYRNNVVGTLTLLEAMNDAGIKKFVFSSTCATYGVPTQVPIPEDHAQNPINPYGATKLMVERILADFDQAYDFRSVAFRYFNAAGADPGGQLGEAHDPETHLIPLVLFAALGRIPSVSILGTDYDTPDGTCIRDYIHVTDLAQAHVQGLEYLIKGGKSDRFNLGNGSGFSVREVIETAREVTGRSIVAEEKPRRAGDPPALVGSGDRARQVLGWDPQYADLKTILTHAWAWHLKRHGI
jgi:UDP-glucose 4-epimerase